jgi:DNA-directed RNA polymerase specialized sigma24 family protein
VRPQTAEFRDLRYRQNANSRGFERPSGEVGGLAFVPNDQLAHVERTASHSHPVLSKDARIALTLRVLGGLTTEAIARAFLVPASTISQRIVRAKRTGLGNSR